MPKINTKKKVVKRPKTPSGVSQDATRHRNKAVGAPVRPKTGGTQAAAHSQAAMAVCALSNPFCDGAIGARYLDAAAHRSLPYTLRFAVALGTGSGGGGMVAVKACPDGIYTMVVNGATDSPTTPATWTLAGGPPPGWDDARITSWGVKGSNVVEPMDSSGVVRVLSLNEPPLVNTAFNFTSYTYDTVETYPLSPGTTLHWISKPVNIFQTRRLLGPATNATTDTADSFMSGWQSVVFATIGAKASTAAVLYLEVVAHYEFTVKPADPLVPYQRPVPPPVPRVTNAVQTLTQVSPQTQWNKTDASVDDWFKTAAKGALTMGAKAAGEWAMNDGLPMLMEGFGMLFA